MSVLNPEKTTRILRLLRQNTRGLTISALSSRTKMNRNLMAKYLDVLLYSGQVEMQVTGTAKVYFTTNRVPVAAMIEFSSDYILVLDASMNILQTNARLLSLMEAERDSVVGSNLIETSHPFLQELPLQDLPADLHQFEGKTSEFRFLFGDGERVFRIKQVPLVFEDGSKGQAIILEDITTQRAAEDERQRYFAQMEFFSRKLQEFIELPPGADIFKAIGTDLDNILPDTIIDINIYDPVLKILSFRAMYGKNGQAFYNRLRDCNCRWDAAPAFDYVPEVLASGKIYPVPGGLHEVTFHQIPEDECRQIADELNLGEFYSVGLNWRGKLLGNILFVLPKGVPIRNVPFVETYARAASIALQRHIIENSSKNAGRCSERSISSEGDGIISAEK